MKNNYAYDIDQLVWDVINEAVALREHATAEERWKLDFTTLDAGMNTQCIYGQMTGHCHSKRALELIQSCTPRYFMHGALSDGDTVKDIIDNTNGTSVFDFATNRGGHNQHFSAIEVFINLEGSFPLQVESLVKYLRGESDDLNVYIF